MGVYIKGQDLPKEGKHYLLQINSDGTVYDAVGRRIAAQAVPVPPHGRLIESKAFLKVAHETDDFSLDELGHLAVLVAATPTIILADDPKEE